MTDERSPITSSNGTGTDSRPYGPAAVALLTVALTTWPIAFNLGAYSAVFYQDVFQVVVVSTVGFVLTIIKPTYRASKLWFTRIALASPFVWMALAVTFYDSVGTAVTDPVYGSLGLAVAVVSIPTVLRLLIDMFARELTTVHDARILATGVVVIAVIAAIGFAVGKYNHAFLTCEDFKIAGSDQPTNCAPE